jgi:alpha-L-rhamnosidase
MVIVPLRLYQYYGDIRILQFKHQIMVEYLGYLVNRAGANPYLNDGGLGDWLTLGKSINIFYPLFIEDSYLIDTTTPKGVTSTFGFYQAATAMAEVEGILGNTAEQAYYHNISTSLQHGFHSMWFNNTGFPHYCQNSQGCNALALDMGAVPEQYKDGVLKAIIDSIEARNWHLTVGEIALPSTY